MSNSQADTSEVVNDKPEWFALIKTSSSDYERLYEKSLKRPYGIVWNWGTYFGGELWFAYRKMYGLALLSMIMLIFFFIFYSKSIYIYIYWVMRIMISIWGSKFYFSTLEKKYKEGARPKTYKDTNILVVCTAILLSIGVGYLIYSMYLVPNGLTGQTSNQIVTSILLFLPILFYYIKDLCITKI